MPQKDEAFDSYNNNNNNDDDDDDKNNINYGNHGTVLIVRQVFRQMEQVTCCLMFFKGDSITIDKHETTLSNKINN